MDEVPLSITPEKTFVYKSKHFYRFFCIAILNKCPHGKGAVDDSFHFVFG